MKHLVPWFVMIVVVSVLACGQTAAQQKTSPPPAKPAAPAGQPTPPPPKKRLVVDLSGFEIQKDKDKKERTSLGATRGGSLRLPIVLAPGMTRLYGASALFAWHYPGRSQGFEVVFTGDDDSEILRQQVNATEYRTKSSSERFQPGKTYYWSVQAFPPLVDTTSSEPAGFVMVSAEERAKIEKELAGKANADAYQQALEQARVFTNYRLWYDAIGAYTDLIRQYSNRAELYEERGMIYAQIEVTKSLADADFENADELRQTH